MTDHDELRYRFIGRWRAFFDYSAPLVFRFRIKDEQYYSHVARSPHITKRYRDELIGYEYRYVQSRFAEIREKSDLRIAYNAPERAAHELAYKLKSLGHADQFLFHKWNNFWPVQMPEGSEVLCFSVDGGDEARFDLDRWLATNAPGTYSLHFIVRSWKNYKSGYHIPVKRLRYADMHPDLLATIRKLSSEGVYTDLKLPLGEPQLDEHAPTRTLKVDVIATDINDAIHKALRMIHMNGDSINVTWERTALDPLTDFHSTVVVGREGRFFPFRWKQVRNNLRRITLTYRVNTRRTAQALTENDRGFSGSLSAYADALNGVVDFDTPSALRALCTGLETLIGPAGGVIIDTINKRSDKKISKISQLQLMTIYTKIVSIDYARDLFADFIGDVNSRLRRTGAEPLKVRDSFGMLSSKRRLNAFLYGNFGPEGFILWPYVRMLSYVFTSYRSFLISISTRFYLDFVHAIVTRNEIIHGNSDLSNEYALGLLGHTYKMFISMRIASANPGEDAQSDVDLGKGDETYIRAILILLYEFNWFTGVIDNDKYPSSSEGVGLEVRFLRGHLDWHGKGFRERVDAAFLVLRTHIDAAVAEYGERYFFGMSRREGLLS